MNRFSHWCALAAVISALNGIAAGVIGQRDDVGSWMFFALVCVVGGTVIAWIEAYRP